MTHPNDAPLKPSDEARRLVKRLRAMAATGCDGLFNSSGRVAKTLREAADALEATQQNTGETPQDWNDVVPITLLPQAEIDDAIKAKLEAGHIESTLGNCIRDLAQALDELNYRNTTQNAGEAKPLAAAYPDASEIAFHNADVASQVAYGLDVEPKGEPNQSVVEAKPVAWTTSQEIYDLLGGLAATIFGQPGVNRNVPLYLAAPPHADLVARIRAHLDEVAPLDNGGKKMRVLNSDTIRAGLERLASSESFTTSRMATKEEMARMFFAEFVLHGDSVVDAERKALNRINRGINPHNKEKKA